MITTTLRECPGCGRQSWRPDLSAGSWRLVRCRCGLRALDADMAETETLANNEKQYGGDDYNEWYKTVRPLLRERYAGDLDEIERRLPRAGSPTILDVGCSYGWFLEVAAERGWSATGVEVTDETASVARAAGLDVRTGTLQEGGFADGSFDVVCLWDVLEHIPDVDAFLAEVRRVLRPGGLLAVQSPNVRSVMARAAGAEWSWLLLPFHVWHFTPASIRATLARRGFGVERTFTWEPSDAFVADVKPYQRWPWLVKGPMRRVTARFLPTVERAWCRAGFGGLVKVYARRPA